jgi:hypothetical protein
MNDIADKLSPKTANNPAACRGLIFELSWKTKNITQEGK